VEGEAEKGVGEKSQKEGMREGAQRPSAMDRGWYWDI